MAQFAKLNIGAGKNFDFGKLPAELQQAVVAGLGDVKQDVEALMQRINAGEVGSADAFGTREYLKNNYLYRFIGVKLGLYGNTATEARYIPYFVSTPNISGSTLQRRTTRFVSQRVSYHPPKRSGRSRCTTARPSFW